MIEDMIAKLIEQAPSLAVMVWLVYSLRQDVRYLTETIVEFKTQMLPPPSEQENHTEV